MTGFEPKGDRARWRVVYDVLAVRVVGAVVTYEVLADVLDLDPEADRGLIQATVRRAAREYEEVDSRALEAVPNVGYRVVEPTEHMRLARGQQRRSHKALARGHSKVVHVDLSGLDPEARRAFEIVAQAFAMQMDFNRRMDVRQGRLEQVVRGIGERHERSEAEILELKARLERLELEREGDTDL